MESISYQSAAIPSSQKYIISLKEQNFSFCLYSINDNDNIIKNKLSINTKQKVMIYLHSETIKPIHILNVTSP
jgi:hypothetical protein